jgi:hypothetical protein
MPDLVDYLVAALLGVVVGGTELISRYRDAPQSALFSRPAWLYVFLNAAASVLALALARTYGWTFGATGPSQRWTQVFLAGIGAMAVFRTSLFTVRAGDRDVNVGPGLFLQILRDAADREVDRARAQARGKAVAQLMRDVDFEKASKTLVPYCLALMQNVSDGEQKDLMNAVETLASGPMDGAIKGRILGLQLMKVVGPVVLTAAVEALRGELAPATHSESLPPGPS